MAKGPVTIIDLATQLNLSKTSVSAALSGSGRISDETRQRVLELARELGYSGNRAARQLRSRTTGAIGLYIPAHVRNLSFYMEFAFGAADEAATLGYDLTLLARPATLAGSARAQVDGVIAVDPLPGDATLAAVTNWDMPLVTAGRLLADASGSGAAVIEADHYRMASEVLELLARHGAKRPAFLASDSTFASSYTVDIARAYEDWSAAHRLRSLVERLPVTADDGQLRTALGHLIEAGADAVVCAVQGMAGRSVILLNTMGHTAGGDILLGAFAGDPVTEIGSPAVTAADLEPRSFGGEAAAFLHEIILDPALAGTYREHASTVVPATGMTARG